MVKIVQKIEAKKPLIQKRKRVCGYARVSTGKYAMLHSLSAQISYYSRYIQSQNNWQYAGVYADKALTGTKDNRAEFQRMLDDCRAGKIDMIITKSITRFARNAVNLLEVIRELRSIGVDVWFENENIHSINKEGELLLTLLAAVAQAESLSVSENCKWKIRHNYEQGIANGFKIYGYNICKRKITINKEQADVVREIFDMYIKGIGSVAIAKVLNDKGIPSPKGYQWHQGVIIEILKNEKYIGDLLLQKHYSQDHISKKTLVNKGELKQYYVTGNHDPIIDRDTFCTVQKIIERKEKINPHVEPYEYQFKGLIFCGNCGGKYFRKKVHTGTPSEKYVWKCSTYNNKGKQYCENKQIPDDVLINMASRCNKEINTILILENNRVQFEFSDGTKTIMEWSIDRTWDDETKKRNYYNQRRRYLND